ncbi:MAG TPA: CoA-transferase [Methylomirabilota bacterium]|nr:CoA-transferase [Methylomirabilota bacterium]
MRDHKRRDFVDKTATEQEAVAQSVHDGDYVSFDFSSFTRGPIALIREIIRQGRRNLWYCAKFTLMESTLLAAAGAVSRIDVGFMGLGDTLNRMVEAGEIQVTEWTNGTLTLRHLAGAMGVPFLPTRAMLGSDTLTYSGAKVVRDPFGGKPVALVPALNPDVGLIHVHQADIYGNARCFGPGVSPLETAMAAKRVIVTADEIIDHDDIRKDPGKTTIPYYMVDAVVYAPFGAYPGGVQGLYEMDFEHFAEYHGLERQGRLKEYLDKYVYSVASNTEMLEKRVGLERLNALRRRATVREGYR